MRILRFLRRWNELWSLPIAVVLFFASAPMLRAMDPTAAVFDAGVLQVVLFGAVVFLTCTGLTWISLKLAFPKIYQFLDDTLEKEIASKNNDYSYENKGFDLWRKSLLVFSVYALHLLVAALCMLAVA